MDDSYEPNATILDESPIVLAYGSRQKFRFRVPDINILGRTTVALPVQKAHYTLNGGVPVPFYVEPVTSPPGEPQHTTASFVRLNAPGQFNIEIPTDSERLVEGLNAIEIEIDDALGRRETLTVDVSWDPTPVSLPLEIDDLSEYDTIQDLGQIVDGAFEIDHASNTIRSVSPVAWDALFVLGSPNRSQEATYDVTFAKWHDDTVFAGVSDFFCAHEEQTPDLGIKPGYSTAGLVTIRPNGIGETWITYGQLLKNHDWTWRRISQFSAKVEPETTYSVRHRVIIEDPVNWVQFKIWPKDSAEPESWMADSDTASLRRRFKSIERGSFGLFQFGGNPTSWSNIRVRAIELDDSIVAAIRQKTRPMNIAAVRARDLMSRVDRRFRRFGRESRLFGKKPQAR